VAVSPGVFFLFAAVFAVPDMLFFTGNVVGGVACSLAGVLCSFINNLQIYKNSLDFTVSFCQRINRWYGLLLKQQNAALSNTR
jgi:hypothetical protein